MQIVADLHFHSRYSRAVSQDMVLPIMATWAQKKGIDLLTTGDWTHPLWFREIRGQLEEAGEGVYNLKSQISKLKTTTQNLKVEEKEPLFLLTTEVASIYSQGGRLRRIHNLILAPSFETAQEVNKELQKRGVNLLSDGRPMMGISSKNLLELVLAIDKDVLLVPCHAWTPHFSLYGSESGFDSIEECFGDYAKYIYGIETGLSCYDEETEVLTDDGWKKFSRVQYKDKISTLNLKTDKIEFQKPSKIHSYRYKGKMYRLKTKRVDLLVTPNHKLLVSGCDFRKPPRFFLKEAEFLFNKSKRFKKDGIWVGVNSEYFILPTVKIKHGSRYYSGYRMELEKRLPIKSWLKFFGFWLAEGWTTKGGNGDYNVCLANKDENLLSKMKGILENFGYKVYWDRKINNTLRIRDYQLYNYLKQLGGSSNKFIPSEIKSLSTELLDIFFKYYIKGDGHRYGRNGKGLSATTISVRLRDDLQEIALKLGMSAYYKLHNEKGTLFKSPGYNYKKMYKQSADSWVIYFIRKNVHTVLPSTIKRFKYVERWVDFEGKVFCVTVPNHVIYVRRNGIPVWCGNSDPEMNWRIKELENRSILSFSDAHSPAKMGREATVFEIPAGEPLSYQAIKQAIQQSSNLAIGQAPHIAYSIEFYPEEGKYHYTGHRNCNVVQSPEQTKTNGFLCPVCHRQLTVGVMHRVEQLADKSAKLKAQSTKLDSFGLRWIHCESQDRPPFAKLVPLLEILSEALSSTTVSSKVKGVYEQLVSNFGSEIAVLLKTELSQIEKLAGPRIAQGIKKVRKGDIFIRPGFDGEYGKVKIWGENESNEVEEVQKKVQLGLF